MNTDDERREEFTKKSLNMDQNALNNGTVNGEIYSEANELEDLKKENNIRTCFSKKDVCDKFPCILVKYKANNNRNNLSASDSFYSREVNLNEQKLGGSLSSGIYSAKKKKTHYTIRRAPGKIAHLLMQPKEEKCPDESPKFHFSETPSQNELKASNVDCKIANEILVENRRLSNKTLTLSNVEIRNGSSNKRERFFDFFKHKKVPKNDEVVDEFLKKEQRADL
jgi:hypothetical protein